MTDNNIKLTPFLKRKALDALQAVPDDQKPREAFFEHRGHKMCIRQGCKCINYRPTAQIWAAFDFGGILHWYKIGQPLEIQKGE